MLKDLKIGTPKKLGLAFIFSFAIVCIALDIVRVAEAISQNQALYTILEINLVVVISCLPTYRTLLGVRKRMQSRRIYAWTSLAGDNHWRSRDGHNHPLRARNSSDREMGARPIQITQDLEMSNIARDRMPLDSLDTISKPARTVPTPGGRTRAFS